MFWRVLSIKASPSVLVYNSTVDGYPEPWVACCAGI